MKSEVLSVSVGRDYRLPSGYEYCVFRGEEIVARSGPFASARRARNQGVKAAKMIMVVEASK